MELFESDNAPGRGVVTFISNRKFLTGWPYAGLRKSLRERFDRIEIVDLRGDVRAGPRGNVVDDQGVFNIMVGTCITICVADGTKAAGTLAEVTYNDSWAHGLFGRRAKLDWLNVGSGEGSLAGAVLVDRGPLEDFRPRAFENGEWVSLRECFQFGGSGIQTKRDQWVYASSESLARQMLERLRAQPIETADSLFSSTVTRPVEVARAQIDHYLAEDKIMPVRQAAYRPLDRRYIVDDINFVDRPRPELRRVWGVANRALYAMPSATSAGPSTWAVGYIPDYHSFRGSYGGYAFPLYDRRAGPDATNLDPTLVAALGGIYGQPTVTPADIFDAILALLSATSYTRRFAEDLEDVFPHVPFPATRAVFENAVAIGREICAVETFARKPEARFRPLAFFRLETQPTTGAPLMPTPLVDGVFALCEDGSGRVSGVPDAVWSFAVSGYRVLPRWIEARRGLPAEDIWPELRDVAARIAELIHRFDEADLVLDATLADTLTREELGLVPPDGANGDE